MVFFVARSYKSVSRDRKIIKAENPFGELPVERLSNAQMLSNGRL